jgi:hypothetical protein
MLRFAGAARNGVRSAHRRPLHDPLGWQRADSFALGSIEYAVEHFKSPLLVVLGHSRCGAVIAILDIVNTKGSGW